MSESDSPQTIDIVTRLRQWQDRRGNPTPGEVMDEAAAEIERLRLTDAEREAIRRSILELDGSIQERIPTPVEMRLKRDVSLTLCGLLERSK